MKTEKCKNIGTTNRQESIDYPNELNGFSEACYNENSIDDLVDALESDDADKTDCKTWGITPSEWRTQIAMALRCRVAKLMEEINYLRE